MPAERSFVLSAPVSQDSANAKSASVRVPSEAGVTALCTKMKVNQLNPGIMVNSFQKAVDIPEHVLYLWPV
jgi:hypothetical protein